MHRSTDKVKRRSALKLTGTLSYNGLDMMLLPIKQRAQRTRSATVKRECVFVEIIFKCSGLTAEPDVCSTANAWSKRRCDERLAY